jgi:hypothetical protein
MPKAEAPLHIEKETPAAQTETQIAQSSLPVAGEQFHNEVQVAETKLTHVEDFSKIELVEDAETDELTINERKKGFWERATFIARQANKLGIKSVDGLADEKRHFRISFNAFSVEKH